LASSGQSLTSCAATTRPTSTDGSSCLPLTVLRRLDATLAPTKAGVLAKDADLERQGLPNRAKVLERVAGVPFYNTSPLDFRRLLDDPEHIAAGLRTYIAGTALAVAGDVFAAEAIRAVEVRLHPAWTPTRRTTRRLGVA